MTDRRVRIWTCAITALAVLVVVLGFPTLLRVPIVLAFALLAPGLALTRYMPGLTGADRLAVSAATSLSFLITTSLSLVAFGQWSGTPVLLIIAAITLALSFAPARAPWKRRKVEQARLRNEQIRTRRRAQEQAYAQVQSARVDERREGLMALSWLLEDDDRSDEAARLRALSRMQVPPRLPLGDAQATSDLTLQETHKRARSKDPETRRQGLFEVAELLDESGRESEAGTLRDLATNDQDL